MAIEYPSAPHPIEGAAPLEPFIAELVPPQLETLGTDLVTVRAAECRYEMHPQLPLLSSWGYGLDSGPVSAPGAALEVPADTPTHIRFANDLQRAELPFDVVVVPDGDGSDSPQNRPGTDGVEPVVPMGAPVGWLIAHLHGSHTEPESDGWTDQMRPPGKDHYCRFSNDDDNEDLGLFKVGPQLWYHDHAMNATRLHVYAGLAGPYIIRHPRETDLGLPTTVADGEAVLFIQDRNLHATPAGEVRLLHKTTDGTSEFFGPYTLVNGKLWPCMAAIGETIRLRIYSGANARFFRLHFLDEMGEQLHHRVQVIGGDGGLLWRGHQLDEQGVTLGCAERIDLLVDLRGLNGQRMVVVNSASAPFSGEALTPEGPQPGEARPDDLLAYPQVMCIDVVDQTRGAASDPSVLGADRSTSGGVWDAIAEGMELNPAHRRLSVSASTPAADEPLELVLPENAPQRLILLSENDAGGMLLQTEVGRDDNGEIEIQLPGEADSQRYRALAADFYETITIMPVWRRWEIWHFLNTTGDTHPMHIHQSFHQPLGANATAYRSEGRYDQSTRATTAPIVPDPESQARRYEAHETNGWKDTIRVDPNSMVSVAIRFDLVGRYVYHCHMIEHEDSAMMRPFVVTPVSMS